MRFFKFLNICTRKCTGLDTLMGKLKSDSRQVRKRVLYELQIAAHLARNSKPVRWLDKDLFSKVEGKNRCRRAFGRFSPFKNIIS